jgi:DNA-binding transcriptional LysR family regulator
MNLRQIEVFRAVMLAGTVSGAAKVLNVSQPGISRMLGAIEQRLGLRLFDRVRGRLRPTPEAEALYAQVQRVHGEVQRVATLASDLRHGRHLSLRILGSPSLMLESIPKALTALRERFDLATFQLATMSAAEMTRALLCQEADIAVSANPLISALPDSALEARVLGSWTLVCVFPGDHPFARSTAPIESAQILEQPLVGFPAQTPQGQFVDQESRKLGLAPRQTVEVRSSLNACALVLQGAGVAVIDDLTARAYVSRDLQFRPIPGAPHIDIMASTPPQVTPSALVEPFIEELADVLGPA